MSPSAARRRTLALFSFLLTTASLIPLALPLVTTTRHALAPPPPLPPRPNASQDPIPLSLHVSLVLLFSSADSVQVSPAALSRYAALASTLAATLPSSVTFDSRVHLFYASSLTAAFDPSLLTSTPPDPTRTVLNLAVWPRSGAQTQIKGWGLVTNLSLPDALPVLDKYVKMQLARHTPTLRRQAALGLLHTTYDLALSLLDSHPDRAHALACSLASDPSIVPTMYISGQNRVAIFAPLIIPGLLPLVISLCAWLRARAAGGGRR
jgi:hypothetical protein